MAEEEMRRLASLIDTVLGSMDDATIDRVRGEVHELTAQFPLYQTVTR
jgi:glycine/serine hydroxymethyltransferase